MAISRYWRPTGREHPDDYATTVRTVRELVEDAVIRQTVADVPISSMLSGGIDSTSISGIATRWLRDRFDITLPTFCVEFDTDEEHFVSTALRPEIDAPYAFKAAEFMGSQHNRVQLTGDDLTAAIPRARTSRDYPSLGQFDSSMLLLFEQMRRCSTVVALSAESADETFGGYPWHHDPATVNRDGFPWMGDAPRLGSYLAGRHGEAAADFERACYVEQLATAPVEGARDPQDRRMREVLYFNQLGPLQYLLQRADRVSMAVGLEVRVPYCDHRIVDYATSIPWEMKARDGRMKAVLADGGEQIALEMTSQVTAVLQCKRDLVPPRSPLHQRQMPVVGGRDRLLTNPSPYVVEGDDRVRPLVGISSDHDHAAGSKARASTGRKCTEQRGHASIGHEPRLLPSHAAAQSKLGGAAHRRKGHQPKPGQRRNERTLPSKRSVCH